MNEPSAAGKTLAMQGAYPFRHSAKNCVRPAVALLSCAVLALAPAADAALSKNMMPSVKPGTAEPVLMDAAEMRYDQRNAVVVAKGSVEVTQGDYVLLADSITYDQKSNIVKAQGNVSVLEPTGNVYFANEVTLQDDLQAGVVDNFRARLSDNSTFAAREARKISETVTELDKAVYSPCKLCRDRETGAPKDPLWQIKADHVRIDEEAQNITYRNAYMEVYGVPVLYTPYLRHATPGADNKSGVLLPEYTQSSNLGSVVKLPYYYTFGPDRDMTLTPILTSKEGFLLLGEYRQLFDNGLMNFEGSITRPNRRDEFGNETDGNETRGHIRGHGDFALENAWGWGFDVNRATDDTYLRRYNFGYEDTLTTRVFAERVKERNYTLVQGLAFQGLTVNDDPDRSPLVAPYMEAHYETLPGWRGSRFDLNGNSMVLTRNLGSEFRRVSFNGGWGLPYTTPGGHVFETRASVRTDLYSVNDVAAGPTDPDYDGLTGRLIPQIEAGWRYPLVRRFGDRSLVLEPIANVILSVEGGNPAKIPNEDSQSLDFSDANLFSANRYPGYDRVESGPRANYGLRAQYQWADTKDVHFIFGQSYRASDNGFPFAGGFDDYFSDYVGRVGYNAAPFDVFYRFRVDKDDLTLQRNEVTFGYGEHPISFSLSYISLEDDPVVGDREEIFGATGIALSENWTLTANARRDLSDGGGMISNGVGVIFQNECVTLLTGLNRNYTRDRDVEPDTSFTVRLLLKNLN